MDWPGELLDGPGERTFEVAGPVVAGQRRLAGLGSVEAVAESTEVVVALPVVENQTAAQN